MEKVLKMKDGTESVIGINWEDVKLKTFKLDQEIIDEMTDPDNFKDSEKLRELYDKHSVDPWDLYYREDENGELLDSDRVSFENQIIKNHLIRGIWKISEWSGGNYPRILLNLDVSTNRTLLVNTLNLLDKEIDYGQWEVRKKDLFIKYLEGCMCDIDDRFVIEMEDIEDLSLVYTSPLKKEKFLKGMRKEVYEMIDEHNKQFMGETK